MVNAKKYHPHFGVINLKEFLIENMEDVYNEICSNEYSQFLRCEAFPHIEKIVYNGKNVGFICFGVVDPEFGNNGFSLSLAYILEEYRGKQLFVNKVFELITEKNMQIVSIEQPNLFVMKSLKKVGLVSSLNNEFLVSKGFVPIDKDFLWFSLIPITWNSKLGDKKIGEFTVRKMFNTSLYAPDLGAGLIVYNNKLFLSPVNTIDEMFFNVSLNRQRFYKNEILRDMYCSLTAMFCDNREVVYSMLMKQAGLTSSDIALAKTNFESGPKGVFDAD